MKRRVKALVLIAVLLSTMFNVMIVCCAAGVTGKITVSAPEKSLNVGKTMQLTAKVKTSDGKPYNVIWSSSNTKVATVDKTGKVRAKNGGHVTVTAKIEELSISDSVEIEIMRNNNRIHNYLRDHQILSYRYSYDDNYYYTDDKDCWQDKYGFNHCYDVVAPYILLEYDYIRVYFTYNDLDWMIQLWKGQYGLLFYGSEIGVYTKEHDDKEVGFFTQFNCPDKENWLKMSMTLYHDYDKQDGNFIYDFTRPYDTYWWCTGFKEGHLKNVEPAKELMSVYTVTMKDKEMTSLFTEGLEECGFTKAEKKDKLESDTYFVDGTTVYIKWQNISEAESTRFVTRTAGFLTVLMSIVAAPLMIPGTFNAFILGLMFLV